MCKLIVSPVIYDNALYRSYAVFTSIPLTFFMVSPNFNTPLLGENDWIFTTIKPALSSSFELRTENPTKGFSIF